MASVYKPEQEDLTYLTRISAEASEELKDLVSINTYTATQDDEPAPSVCKTCISDFGEEAFLLHDLLSPAESQHYINEGERLGFGELAGMKKEYRNCDRIMVQSEELADVLWPRLSPYLQELEISGDPHDVHIHGVSTILQGRWKPHRLNHIFRLCRYEPGGHFAPHFDGHFVVSSDERSMKTFMLYLNGDFTGGTTNFVDDNQELHMDAESGRYCAEEKNILCRVKPEAGLAIIFNHHRLHEGEATTSGLKYILRTDIMYKRSGGSPLDPREEKALMMAQEAERLEAYGENMKAMELYRKAFKLSPSVAASYGN